MSNTRFLIMGSANKAKEWAMSRRLSRQRWVHVERDARNLQGIEGPWRNENTPFVLIEVYSPPGYYPRQTYELLTAMGFEL